MVRAQFAQHEVCGEQKTPAVELLLLQAWQEENLSTSLQSNCVGT